MNSPDFHTIIRELSEKIVEAQKPIRILDALKWDDQIQAEFLKSGGKKQPQVDQSYYDKHNPLNFDPVKKIEEFHEIDRDIRRKLGQYSGVGSVMKRMCDEYCRVIEMLVARGKPEFTAISQELYGSSNDAIHIGAPSLKDFGLLAADTIRNIKFKTELNDSTKECSSKEAVDILSKNLATYFNEDENIRVEQNDKIVSDAAAGADVIKIRSDVTFSHREIRAYEVHEGWVHLGTTLNGLSQPICTFLSKGTPSSTVTQEGLAIIVEIFTLSSYPDRVHRLVNRINSVNMAEEGASFIDVYQYHLSEGSNEKQAYQAAYRIFRGSTPEGGPFTKDLSYSKGFMLIYNYIRLAVQKGLLQQIPLLFVGKTTLDDVHILTDLMNEGIITPPKYLPPQFTDLSAISSWMIYSLFLNKLDLQQLALDFKGILR